ncbi:MAG TPA: TonB-dependent receptor [Mucilaginibacter sp.]|jgi:TonB-linked SusC/RagA family outer membrane protein|nr:TonB-dependent receptor [Mucilaginibacter sp.]
MKQKFTLVIVMLLTVCSFAFGQTTVSGLVKDDQGASLPGVTVTIKGTNTAVSTDANGKYSISAPANGTLVFSFIGFTSQEQPVNNRTTIDVALVSSNKQLNEIVVIGYGTQRKSDITSAITTVSVKDVSSRPIVSPEEALIGKAPGVQVTVPSGQPGADLSIRIRGVGSPNGGEPLYVVDGVLTNDIKSLDPNSIESFSILKDASAAGIYGAAGSTNGVVMITTKQGTKGKAQIDADFYTGTQDISKKIPMLNNQQWLALQTEIGGGTAPTLPSYYDLNATNNNWQNIIYHSAMQTGANVAASGGSETGTYYFGLGYLDQNGIVEGSNFDRYSAKFSVSQKINDWLTFGGNVNYNRSNSRTIPQNASAAHGGTILSALVTPEYIPVYMPANAPNPGVYGTSNLYSGENPVSDIYNNTNNTIANNLLGDAFAEIKLPFGIKYRSQLNVTNENSNYQLFIDPYKSLTGIGEPNGYADQNYSETTRWSWDNTLTYDKTFGLSKLNVVVGTEALDEKIFLSDENGKGFGSSDITTLNAATASKNVSSSNYEWSTNSYFGRATYSYNDKYLLTATLRADGTSRVGVNNRWGTFPAFSAGWRVSNEDFMKDINWIQDLKIRGSWGRTGNLPPYSYLYPSYTQLSPVGYPYNTATAANGYALTSQIGNPYLKWETANSSNIGFDAGFLNRRITVSADYYYKKVTDMIFTETLPGTTGSKTIASNLPGNDINKGFEFSIDGSIVRQTDLTWDMNLNMSFNSNVFSGLSAPQPSAQVSLGGSGAGFNVETVQNGYSLGTFWGYKALGVDPKTGNELFSTDETNLGSALPKFTYGIAENLRYKAFSLSLLFDGVYGNKIYNATRQETDRLNGGANESADVLARWEKPGDITSVPGAFNNGAGTNTSNNFLNSNPTSYYVESGSFFRLRNATLGYNFDADLLKKIGVQRLRIFATGQNLFMITKYKGYTPDVNSFGNGTNNKPVNAGDGAPTILSLGVDDGAYPAARVYTIGVNVQF